MVDTPSVVVVIIASISGGISVGLIIAFLRIFHSVNECNDRLADLVETLVDATVTPTHQQIARQDIKSAPSPKRPQPDFTPIPHQPAYIADIPMAEGGMGPN